MLPLTSIPTTFVHLNSFSLHPLWSLFTFPLLDRLQPALQAVQTVLHSASLFRARSKQRQQDAPQHQAAQSDRRGVCTGGLVSHDQSEKPECQDGFHHPKHPPHHANQQAENNGQHPVAYEAHQTPLGDGGHALWSEAGQRQGNCGGRKFSLSILSWGTKHLCVTQEATEVNTHTYKGVADKLPEGEAGLHIFTCPWNFLTPADNCLQWTTHTGGIKWSMQKNMGSPCTHHRSPWPWGSLWRTQRWHSGRWQLLQPGIGSPSRKTVEEGWRHVWLCY